MTPSAAEVLCKLKNTHKLEPAGYRFENSELWQDYRCPICEGRGESWFLLGSNKLGICPKI